MSSTPINLNRVRKQKARAEKRARADANAAKHGRTKEQKSAEDAARDAAKRRLDAHALQKPENRTKDDPETP